MVAADSDRLADKKLIIVLGFHQHPNVQAIEA